jgi:hypothetical protein
VTTRDPSQPSPPPLNDDHDTLPPPDDEGDDGDANSGMTMPMQAINRDMVEDLLRRQQQADSDASTADPSLSLDSEPEGATVALISPFHPSGGGRPVTPDASGATSGGTQNFAVAGVMNYIRNIVPHARRVFRGNLAHNLASMDERAMLAHEHGVTGTSSQSYIAWRRSALVLMIVPLTISLLVSITETGSNFFKIQGVRGMQPEAQTYFVLLNGLKIASYVVSLVLAMLALASWSQYKRSRRLLALSWGISFSVTFLIALVPMRVFFDASLMLPPEMNTVYVLAELQGYAGVRGAVHEAAQALLNTAVGLYVFMNLIPPVMSLLPASIRGSLTLKMLIPESPLMGFVAVTVPLVFVLFGSIFFLMLHQLVGDIWLVGAIFVFLCSPLMYVARAKELTRAMDGEQAYEALRKTRALAGGFAAAGAALFIVFVFESQLMQDLLDKTNLFNPLKITQISIDYVAKYFLTTVVISDLFLRILQALRVQELTHPMRDEHARSREARLDELLTMTESMSNRRL